MFVVGIQCRGCDGARFERLLQGVNDAHNGHKDDERVGQRTGIAEAIWSDALVVDRGGLANVNVTVVNDGDLAEFERKDPGQVRLVGTEPQQTWLDLPVPVVDSPPETRLHLCFELRQLAVFTVQA